MRAVAAQRRVELDPYRVAVGVAEPDVDVEAVDRVVEGRRVSSGAARSSAWIRSASWAPASRLGSWPSGGQRPVHLEQAAVAVDQRLADGGVLEGGAEALLGLAEVALALVAVGHVGDHGDHRGHLVVVDHRGGGEDRPELAAVAAAEADVVELAAVALAPVGEHHPPPVGVVDQPEEGLRTELVGVPPEQLGHAPVGEGGAAVGVDDPHAEVRELEQALVEPVDPGRDRPVGVGRRVAAPLISTSASASLVERSTTSQGRRSSPRRRTGPPSPVHRRWPGALRRWPGPRAGAARRRRRRFEARSGGAEGSRRMRHVPFHASCRAHLTVVLPQLPRADRTCRMVPTLIGAWHEQDGPVREGVVMDRNDPGPATAVRSDLPPRAGGGVGGAAEQRALPARGLRREGSSTAPTASTTCSCRRTRYYRDDPRSYLASRSTSMRSPRRPASTTRPAATPTSTVRSTWRPWRVLRAERSEDGTFTGFVTD